MAVVSIEDMREGAEQVVPLQQTSYNPDQLSQIFSLSTRRHLHAW